MTCRDRVLTALRRTGVPDRVPFEISWGAFTPGLMNVFRERTGSQLDPAEYFDFDTRSVNLNPTQKQTDFRRWFETKLPAAVIWDEWGYGSLQGSMEHFLDTGITRSLAARRLSRSLSLTGPMWMQIIGSKESRRLPAHIRKKVMRSRASCT